MKYDPLSVRRFAESLAALRGNPIELVEKDVWLTYILREIYSLPEGEHLAFKGGTCLVKVYYGYYRFSEDIDLTWFGETKKHKHTDKELRKKVVDKIMDDLGLVLDRHDAVKTGIAGTHSGGIMNYFLLTPKADGAPIKLKLTVTYDEVLDFPPARKQIMPAIPASQQKELNAMFGQVAQDYFNTPTAVCYSLQEIACEKIRAILTRRTRPTRSRDLVDLYVITRKLPLLEAAPAKAVKAKLAKALKIPAYAREFEKNTQDLREHLEQLAVQSTLDPVFIEKPPLEDLKKFANQLENYLADNGIIEENRQKKNA